MTSWMWPWSPVQVADGEQGVDALRQRLADADQESRGERDAELARLVEHAKPDGGLLVGRPLVHLAALAQARATRSRA